MRYTNDDWNEYDQYVHEQAMLDAQEEERALASIEQVPDLALFTWSGRAATESLHDYAGRIVQHIIATGLTGALDDEDLELAHNAIRGMYAGAPSDVMVKALRDAESLISLILRGRRQEQASTALAVIPAPIVTKPNEGPMAPLKPAPIVRPPAPVSIPVSIEF